MPKYTTLAISNFDELCFGVAPRPLTTQQGLVIGGGTVYPELNFTLPPMIVSRATMPQVRRQYQQIIADATRRAVELETPGLVVEFETVPAMTDHPAWAVEITRILLDGLEQARGGDGLRTVLRVTPNDNREFIRPPLLRSGAHWDKMLAVFDGCAAAGAELLSIESTGGKELHDDALTSGDIAAVLFSLCVLGVRDMRFLWAHIVEIARRHGAVPAGDSACGFGNTAMVLADRRMIPRVFAAVVRAITAVRSLVAHECGAVGPGKDCAYENPILKAITGFPMSMEGKTSACAHFSPVGNIAAATCDTWSNESVQNVKLLAGFAPTVYLEQLIYDCRLMNQASAEGPQAALALRRWLVNSDAGLDPQAFVLTPENAVVIGRAIVEAPDYYQAGRSAGLTAIRLLRQGYADGRVRIPDREIRWLDMMESALQALPDEEDRFIEQMLATADRSRFRPGEYELD